MADSAPTDPVGTDTGHIAEVERSISFLRKVTGKEVVLFSHGWTPLSREAAQLAAVMAFSRGCDKNWLAPRQDVLRLAELTGLELQTPFTPAVCPLSAAEVEAALSYLRASFTALPEGPGRDHAIRFVKWAKENQQ